MANDDRWIRDLNVTKCVSATYVFGLARCVVAKNSPRQELVLLTSNHFRKYTFFRQLQSAIKFERFVTSPCAIFRMHPVTVRRMEFFPNAECYQVLCCLVTVDKMRVYSFE